MKRLCDNLKGLLKKCCAPRQANVGRWGRPDVKEEGCGQRTQPEPCSSSQPHGNTH